MLLLLLLLLLFVYIPMYGWSSCFVVLCYPSVVLCTHVRLSPAFKQYRERSMRTMANVRESVYVLKLRTCMCVCVCIHVHVSVCMCVWMFWFKARVNLKLIASYIITGYRHDVYTWNHMCALSQNTHTLFSYIVCDYGVVSELVAMQRMIVNLP